MAFQVALEFVQLDMIKIYFFQSFNTINTAQFVCDFRFYGCCCVYF